MALMRNLMKSLSVLVLVGCGASTTPSPEPAQSAVSAAATATEPKVSDVVRTRLPKETACGSDDVCGFYLQVFSPGSDPGALVDHAMKILRGHCGGTVIVYRDKRGVMGSGSVFATEEEKRACATALGTAGGSDDYPSSAVWRKAE